MKDTKMWMVKYNHNDGRNGKVKVTTEIHKSADFEYGNHKTGSVTVEGYTRYYDLRYCTAQDLHTAMVEDYFGGGLQGVTEINY